jgi:hypothetical protein
MSLSQNRGIVAQSTPLQEQAPAPWQYLWLFATPGGGGASAWWSGPPGGSPDLVLAAGQWQLVDTGSPVTTLWLEGYGQWVTDIDPVTQQAGNAGPISVAGDVTIDDASPLTIISQSGSVVDINVAKAWPVANLQPAAPSTAYEILAPNPSRRGVILYAFWSSAAVVSVAVGQTLLGNFALSAGQYWEMPAPIFQGELYGSWTAVPTGLQAGLSVTEIT